MGTKLALRPDKDDARVGTVCAALVSNGEVVYGDRVGTYSARPGAILIDLDRDLDIIKHEVATRKGVRAELRAAEKDAKGVEKPSKIEYDPQTRRFRQVLVE